MQVNKASLLVISRGHQETRYADEILSKIDGILARGIKLHVFHDAEAMTTFDREWRNRLEAWGREHIHRRGSWHVLVSRPMTTMAATVSNLEYDGFMTIHKTRPTFDAAMTKS